MGVHIRSFGLCLVLGLCISVSLQHPIINAKREAKIGEWTKVDIPQMTEELPNQKLDLPGGKTLTLSNGNYQGPSYEEFVLNSLEKDEDSIAVSITTKFPEMTFNFDCAECHESQPTSIKIVVEDLIVNLDTSFVRYEDGMLDEGKVDKFDHQFKSFGVFFNDEQVASISVREKYNLDIQAFETKIGLLVEEILSKEMQTFSDAFILTFKTGIETAAKLSTNIERPEVANEEGTDDSAPLKAVKKEPTTHTTDP